MNGAQKFHSPDGPAFNEGEVWEAAGGHTVTILHTKRHGVDKWDVDVYYTCHKMTHRKNAWSFQVRYQHIADKEI